MQHFPAHPGPAPNFAVPGRYKFCSSTKLGLKPKPTKLKPTMLSGAHILTSSSTLKSQAFTDRADLPAYHFVFDLRRITFLANPWTPFILSKSLFFLVYLGLIHLLAPLSL